MKLIEFIDVPLSEDEILTLDGRVNDKAQSFVDHVKQKRTYIGLTTYEQEVLASAQDRGALDYSIRQIDSCPLCDKKTTYVKYKSGYNKGRANYDKPIHVRGYSFNDGFITIKGYSSLGFCIDCGQVIENHVVDYILTHDLHNQLARDERSKYLREDSRNCYKCNAHIWEFDMGLSPTLMDVGYYYSKCSECGAEAGLFVAHKTNKAFRVVPISSVIKRGTCYQRSKEDASATK
jgi:hypothetical protein